MKPQIESFSEYYKNLKHGKNTLRHIQNMKMPISMTVEVKLYHSFSGQKYKIKEKYGEVNGLDLLIYMNDGYELCMFSFDERVQTELYANFKFKIDRFRSEKYRIYSFEQAFRDLKKEYKKVVNEKIDYHAPHVVDNIVSFVM